MKKKEINMKSIKGEQMVMSLSFLIVQRGDEDEEEKGKGKQNVVPN